MLEIINIDASDKWDSIVKSFKNYDVYYLSGYTKAFNIHGDGEPILIYYQDEEFRAINVVMKRDIGKDKKFIGKIDSGKLFDFTTPYGYGGFIYEGETDEIKLKILEKVYSEYCFSNNIISEFVRFHPLLDNASFSRSIYEIISLGKTITVDLISKEQIWKNLSSKNRNAIRKATKLGVEIFWGRSPELINEFIPIYNATMNIDNATDYYYFDLNFYRSILYDFKYNSLLFYAVYNQRIISMSMILLANNKMHYHLSASDREYNSFAATNLLLYEAACWGCENGYNVFHLGGGLGSKEDSLYKFKAAFNKNSETRFSIGKKIFNDKAYNDLIQIRKQETDFINDNTFFPSYRK